MRLLLTVFAVLLILFGGGCAFIFGNDGGMGTIILLGIAVFNLLLVVALWSNGSRKMLIGLAVVDGLLAAGLLALAAITSTSTVGGAQFVLLLAALVAGKGALTYFSARKQQP